VAAGSHWQFPLAYKDAYGLQLSGVDIHADAMNRNDALDFRYEADVCNISIIGKGNYDLLTCHSGIEYFQNVKKFLDTAFLSLRPGGAAVAQFPWPLAPFAIINKLLPQELKKKLLNSIYGSDADEKIGYPAYYDKRNVVIAPLGGPRNVPDSRSNITCPHAPLATIFHFCSLYFYCHSYSTLFAWYSAQKIWHLTTFSFCAVLEIISRLNGHGILISRASHEQDH
jgi:hypothetical protein